MKLKTFLILLFLSVLFADVSAVNDTIILNSEIYTERFQLISTALSAAGM